MSKDRKNSRQLNEELISQVLMSKSWWEKSPFLKEEYKKVKKPHFTTEQAKEIGEKLGIDWKKSEFDVEQFRMGMDVELEHGNINQHTNVTNDDTINTAKIALAHLNEISNYYTLLDEMEKKGKETKNPIV
ncbi:MAG TPA: hypothetical protein P5293_06860 [Bacteroidales bacterium]|nr:hypothetical protein [Bacteroidales bacterium]